ncbi:MAG: DNA repair protein RadC [Proteobacteria bacterium]|nr:DNA repair protein RadC [Pseudomonadota bacterium]
MTTPKKNQPMYIREIELRYKKRRVKSEAPVHEPLTDAKKVYELFSDLQNEAKEKLITISLDTKLKMLCFEVIAVGSVNAIYARPFEALRASIPLNPYGVIMVHNHPSGDPTPSEGDKIFTSNLLLYTIAGGIEFHDHIIIGHEKYFSFAKEGLMDALYRKAYAEHQKALKGN